MKKKNLIIGSVLLVVAAIAVFYYMKRDKGPQVTFVTATIERGDVSKSITATGTLQPVDTVSVGSQVSGVIKHIYIDFNDVVKKGQLIAKIDPAVFEAQVKAAQANAVNTKSNMEYQQTTYDRQSKLFKLGAISKADYQLALNQKEIASAAFDNAKALLSIAKRNLFYTDITSPIDGVVLNRAVAAGQTIAASFNAPTLFVIAKDLTKMQVRAAVDEADIGDVKAGQKVSFTVDTFPDEYFKGIVEEILLHAKTSANVVTYTTLINVDNTSLKLKPGMTANIYIYTEEIKNAMLIPLKALSFKPDSTLLKSYVFKEENNFENVKNKLHKKKTSQPNNENSTAPKTFVWIKKGNTLIRKRIFVGINDDTNAEVIKGLSKNDSVITNVISETADNGSSAQQSPFVPKFNQKPAKQNK